MGPRKFLWGGHIYIYSPGNRFPRNQGELTSVHENCCLKDPTGFHVTYILDVVDTWYCENGT